MDGKVFPVLYQDVRFQAAAGQILVRFPDLEVDVDVKGGITVMEEFPDQTISIFIEPPGDDLPEQLEILEERLNQRGNEPPQLIVKRLKRFPLEIEYKDKFMFHFVNEELDETIKDVEKVIKENVK